MYISEAVNIFKNHGINSILQYIENEIHRRKKALTLLGNENKSYKLFENDLGDEYELLCSLEFCIKRDTNNVSLLEATVITDEKIIYEYSKVFPCISYDFLNVHSNKCLVMHDNVTRRNDRQTMFTNASIFELIIDSSINIVQSFSSMINSCTVKSRYKDEIDVVRIMLRNLRGNRHSYANFGDNEFTLDKNVFIICEYDCGKVHFSYFMLKQLCDLLSDRSAARAIRKKALKRPSNAFLYIDKGYRVCLARDYVGKSDNELTNLIDKRDLHKLVNFLQSLYFRNLSEINCIRVSIEYIGE